ncbi:hypothetical protein CASFOL_004323 [Castilleja foliolosa]|uniref:F-box domain-containing protein n=1 Tax=Castilleja foliolosa TaxID=1961234 RepID=A0ABD3EA90_9LAMI
MNSAEIVVSIDDLLQEILTRVPIKPLARFQLVSKHWHSLISDPRFCCRMWFKTNIGLNINMFPSAPIQIGPQKIDFTQNPYGIQFYPSCNGLLLCRTYREGPGEPRYYVYNPTTNKFSTFLKPGNVEEIGYMHLVFDPSKSHHYKIVCIKVVSLELKLHQVGVYSSETCGPWVKCGGPYKFDVDIATGVYWNGAIHWLKHLWCCRNVTRDSLYFNPDDLHHRLAGPQIMLTPPIHHRDYRCFDYYFGESCNHLHYIAMIKEQTHFTVYEMRADYSEWFVKYRVEACQVMDACWDNLKPKGWWNYYRFRILTMVRGDKEEDSFLILKFDRKITKYNLVSGSFETIYEFDGNEPSKVILFQYIESMCHV